MAGIFDNLFGGGASDTGSAILQEAKKQNSVNDVIRDAGGAKGDAYCMHSITAAAKAAGYNELYNMLRRTGGNVNSFMQMAKKYGAYHAGQGQIPPKGTAAIMDIRSQPGVDHIGISYGDGRYREANPGFNDVYRGGEGIVGYVDLEALNRSLTRKRGSELESEERLKVTEAGPQPSAPNVPDARSSRGKGPGTSV